MPNIAIVNTAAHQMVRVRTEASAALGDGQRFVPVIVDEFPHLSTYCPIFFAKDADTGAFYCGAMLGFREGENLFLDHLNADRYRPLNLKRQPFFTAGDDLAIDLDSVRVSHETGDPLFDEQGKPSSVVERAMGYFQRLRPGEAQTKVFIQTMLQFDLIEPIDIDIAFDDGENVQIDGLYVIKKTGLAELSDHDALMLYRRGYLYLAHTMMTSLGQVAALIERRNAARLGAQSDFQL
jgi:hypothetical protein